VEGRHPDFAKASEIGRAHSDKGRRIGA
jgi:hypothetical protein